MANPFARQAGHIGKKRDNIRGGQSSAHLFARCGDAERPNRGCSVSSHAPKLSREFNRRCLTIGASDGGDMGWNRREETSRKGCKRPARIGGLDVNRTLDRDARISNNRDRT